MKCAQTFVLILFSELIGATTKTVLPSGYRNITNEVEVTTSNGEDDGVHREDRVGFRRIPTRRSPFAGLSFGGLQQNSVKRPTVTRNTTLSKSPCIFPGLPGENGICLLDKECHKFGGVPLQGNCPGAYWCCIARRTCGQETSLNSTYFVNTNYPDTMPLDPGTSKQCDLRVTIADKVDICQLRLDFLLMDMTEVQITDGMCSLDSFTVIGGGRVPQICGHNTGQHIYVDVSKGTNFVMLQANSQGYNEGRRWNIRVDLIPCGSPQMAPAGCLQYFPQRTGIIRSLNYGISATTNIQGTYANNLNYGVCMRREAGYCSMTYTRGSEFRIGMSRSEKLSALLNKGIRGDKNCSNKNDDNNDYIIIPNNHPQGDRFCGGDLPDAITTSSRPYIVYVVTDGITLGETGFEIKFSQNLCS